MGYVPPRDPQGRIITGPLPVADLLDDESSPPSPAPSPPPPPSPPRRPGDTPTAFAQLRPVAAAAPPQTGNWTSYAATLAVIILIGLGVYALRDDRATATVGTVGTTEAAAPADRLPVAMVAYAEPGGAVIGALEPGRPYLVVGRSGIGWLQINIGQPAPVWVRAWDGAAISAVPDLSTPTPRPTATPVPYVAPAYVPLPAPAYVAPTEIPVATCKTVIFDGQQIGQACGHNQAEIMATNQALLSTPRGGVPVRIVTRTPLDPSSFPTAKP